MNDEAAAEAVKNIAERVHKDQLRKDGKTPYIEHPRAVADMLRRWGVDYGYFGWTLAVAWGHDILEESPMEDRDSLCREIEEKTGELSGKILQGIKLLTRDKSIFPNKDDYIKAVAENAEQPVLYVKIADRICNTLDFLKMQSVDSSRDWRTKAREYFCKGRPLFEHLEKGENVRCGVPDVISDEIEAITRLLNGEKIGNLS